MESFDEWFAYESYRPHQKEMLAFAAETVKNGKIGLIDAPTGSGKSSVLSALLAQSKGKKILVAVRTVAQLNIFIRELELIKRKKRSLKTAYLVGKGKMCMMNGAGDVYRMCEGVKAFSTSLMRERAIKGSLIPSNDSIIKKQVQLQDPDHPMLCPYFIKSKVYAGTDDGLKMIPSNALRTKAEQVIHHIITPDKIHEFCGEICPYEVMLQGARDANVVLMNFYHLFSEDVREQLYQSIGIEPKDAIILIDEAHNCADTVQSIQTVTLNEQVLELALTELGHMRGRVTGTEAIMNLIPHVQNFMNGLKRSMKTEDWFDPAVFMRFIINGTLYQKKEDIGEDLLRINEAIHEIKLEKGDFKESPVETLTEFFTRIIQSSGDDSYLTIYKKVTDRETGIKDAIALEVRNIDPSKTLLEVAQMHHSAILVSGTLSPVAAYKKLYFRDADADTLSLENAFPKENRLLFCAKDATSAYSMRRDADNTNRIIDYINTFASLKGNLAVYFPSYDLLNSFTTRLPSRLKGKEVFIESQDAGLASADLRRFLSLPSENKSGILFGVCGGKWSEGLDYRGDLLSGAMVVGLPLAPFNDVRKMVNDYFRMKFGKDGEFLSYTLPAVNKASQALGRVLRTPEDKGVLILVESRYLEESVKKGLAFWMQNEIIPCTIEEFKSKTAGWR